jgi:hypothetical protein
VVTGEEEGDIKVMMRRKRRRKEEEEKGGGGLDVTLIPGEETKR